MLRKAMGNSLAVLVALASLAPAGLAARGSDASTSAATASSSRRSSPARAKHTRRKSSSRARQPATKSAAHTRRRANVRYRRRPASLKQRLAHMRPQPDRVEQIQQALIEAGDLDEQPTGKWDPATREAMSRYQTQNGFAATGLPDAKSLMKMGLGPHPLPAELDNSRADLESAPNSPPQPKSEPPPQ